MICHPKNNIASMIPILVLIFAIQISSCARIIETKRVDDTPTIVAVQVEIDPQERTEIILRPISIDWENNQANLTAEAKRFNICKETKFQMVMRKEHIERTFDPPNSSMALAYIMGAAALIGGGTWALLAGQGTIDDPDRTAQLYGSIGAVGGIAIGIWAGVQDYQARDETRDLGEVEASSASEDKPCEVESIDRGEFTLTDSQDKTITQAFIIEGSVSIKIRLDDLSKIKHYKIDKMEVDKTSGVEYIEQAVGEHLMKLETKRLAQESQREIQSGICSANKQAYFQEVLPTIHNIMGSIDRFFNPIEQRLIVLSDSEQLFTFDQYRSTEYHIFALGYENKPTLSARDQRGFISVYRSPYDSFLGPYSNSRTIQVAGENNSLIVGIKGSGCTLLVIFGK